jgi:hypothetical protein
MSLLRSHRVCTVFRGGGAAQLFSLRGVRGDSRSDGPPPRRREPEGSGPATSAATPCLRRREAARQSRIHPVTQRALTAAFNVLHREHLTEHLAETGDALRSNFVTGCRPSSTEPSALVARWPGRIKRPALAVVSALAARRRDRLLPPRRSFSEIPLEGNATPRRRALPPSSGNRWCDAGRNVLRQNSLPPFRDPASPRQAGRRPDGSAVSHRVSRCGAATAHARSKSSPKGGYPGGDVDRRVRARSHRSDRDAGLCTQAPAAIPIVPLHRAGVRRPLTANLRGEPETLDYLIQGRHPVWRR